MHIYAAGTDRDFAALVMFDEGRGRDTAACLVVGSLSTRRVHGGVEHASLLTMIPIETGAVGTPPRLMWHLRRVRATSNFRKTAPSRAHAPWYAPCNADLIADRYVSTVQQDWPTNHFTTPDEASCSARPFSRAPPSA